MKAVEPRHYPSMELLLAALAISLLVGDEVDVVLGRLVNTGLGRSIAQDATRGRLPCSADYSAGHQGG